MELVIRLAVCFIVALAAVLAIALAAARPAEAKTLAPYHGLAAWVDIYDQTIWGDPEGGSAAIAARGVRTVYLETSNYSQNTAILHSTLLGRFVEAAHAEGIAVVAWYLPGFAKPAVDVERSLAAIRFRTPAGQRFDGFALDIEATKVASPVLRTKRLLRVAGDLRDAVGRRYALGAIIPSPRGLELSPTVWPGFPYAGLAETFDVFLPMVYFTYRTHGRADTRDYVAASIDVLRRETGNPDVPIHVIGGVADRARLSQVRGFVDAVCAAVPGGASLYDYATTTVRQWPELSRLASCVSGTG